MKKYTLFATLAFSAATLFAAEVPFKLSDKIIADIDKATPEKIAKPLKPRKILVFSRTLGYRHHDGIAGLNRAIENMQNKGAFTAVFTENPLDMAPENLKQYDVVVLNCVTGNAFGEKETPEMSKEDKLRFKKRSDDYLKGLCDYVKNGGSVAGFHAGGTDCYIKTEMSEMMGGDFIGHPWGYNSSAVTVNIDDMHSPITRGIWAKPAFRVVDEIYQFGEYFSREKCRALMRLNVEASPVTTEWGRRHKVRADKDLALVWIKNYGKGKVAYSAFGHACHTYKDRRFQELTLRLLQFACGDLQADTSSIKKGKDLTCPLYAEPEIGYIKSFNNVKYGEKDNELNELIYAVCSNNQNAKFCKKMENFVLAELESGNPSSEVYQCLLARIVGNVKISSKKNFNAFKKLAKSPKTNRIVVDILENALAHYKNELSFSGNYPKFEVPQTKPDSEKELLCVIRFLGANKDVALPKYASFKNISEASAPVLAYALMQRSEAESSILQMPVANEGAVVAMSYYAAKSGNEKAFEKVFENAKMLGSVKRRVAAANIASMPNFANAAQKVFGLLAAEKPQRELAAEVILCADFSANADALAGNFDSAKSQDAKVAIIAAIGSQHSEKSFNFLLGVLLTPEKQLKNAALKQLVKTAALGLCKSQSDMLENAIKTASQEDAKLLKSVAAKAKTAHKKSKK